MDMRKKLCLLTLLFLAALPLAALRCGDKAAELPRMKYLHGIPRKAAGPAAGGTLRILTFMHTRVQGIHGTVSMLQALGAMYKEKIHLTAITPDPESDAAVLLPLFKRSNAALAVDSSRRITMQYMAGSLLFPKSFVIDHKGEIIWCGETVDLGEMLQEYFSNRFDKKTAAKVCPMLDELQTLLRESSERKMRQLTNRIFALSPANPAALRMRLFALENSNRIPEAWALLSGRLQAVPGTARIYFTAIDFISRYLPFQHALANLLAQFDKHIKDPDSRILMSWELLKRFKYNITALEYANILLTANAPQKAELRRLWSAARAQVAYQAGDLPKAIKYQQQVSAVPGQKDPVLEFFKKAKELKDRLK